MGRYTLPFAAAYTLNGQPFFDERVLSVVPDDPSLVPASFAAPSGSRFTSAASRVGS